MGGKLIAAFTVAALAGGAFAYSDAQPTAQALTPAPVAVELVARAWGLRSDGGSRGNASASILLASDKANDGALAATAATCQTAAATREGTEAEAYDVTWELQAQLIGGSEDGATVDLQWSSSIHDRSAFDGDPVQSERRRVQLSHGEWLPLDMLRVRDSTAQGCERVYLSITSRVAHDRSVQDAALRHDVWLVHRDADGREVTERIRYSARQDAEVEYLFPSVFYSDDGRRVERDVRGGIELEISGNLRTRARRDGLIDLSLETWRRFYEQGARANSALYGSLMWIGPDEAIFEEDSRGIFGNGGIKLLTVRSGETIEVTLPPVTGKLKERDLSQLFAGQATALRITTTRLR